MSARIDGQLPAPRGIVAQIEFGPQAAHAVMQGFQLLGDIVEMAAPDIRPQAGREEDRSCSAIVTATP